MAVLRIGSVDPGKTPGDQRGFFGKYHEQPMLAQGQFRDEPDSVWQPFTDVSGVAELQTNLQNFGFMPRGPVDGIFGYRTLSAARLFQEYVRTMEGQTAIGAPDGIIGPGTLAHVDRWKANGLQAEWANHSPGSPTPDFSNWLNLLNQVKAKGATNKALQLLDRYSGRTDTRQIAEWDFSPDKMHLVGIRRKEWMSSEKRDNDDIFVLLVNGLAFKFFGSTDPSQSLASRSDEPFIVKGQHIYRFGWHKMSDPKRVYRAFKPAGAGVLAFRDVDNDNALTEADIAQGLQANPSINIHWSGIGTSNWSAGCQVISGKAYINHAGQVVDCCQWAAPSYGQLGRQTRGAYNVLLDLITVYANDFSITGDKLHYTLIYEEDLDLEPAIGAMSAVMMLQQMRG